MFKFDKTEKGYMASIVERVVAERNKDVDSLILGEIRKIAIDNEIETKIILNEKNVAEALRNYQDGYKRIKAEVAREIFEEIAEKLEGLFDFFRQDGCIRESSAIMLAVSEIAELKKKYQEGEPNGSK